MYFFCMYLIYCNRPYNWNRAFKRISFKFCIYFTSESMWVKAKPRSIIHKEVIYSKPPASSVVLYPLSVWPPRSGWPGSRWARVWDTTTCCGQLWLGTFLCGWTMIECVIRAECEGPAVWLWLCRGLTGAAGPLHRVPIIHVGSGH